jgi:hypothetical protein
MDANRFRQRALFQKEGNAPDFSLPRQKDKNISFVFVEGLENCIGDGFLDLPGDRRGQVPGDDGKWTPGTLHQWRIVENCGEPNAIQRGRHDEDSEVLPQVLLYVQTQRKSEIGMDAPFVEFIEDNASNVRERRIFLNDPGEDSLRDHFDARGCRHSRITANTVANRLADTFLQLRRHVFRRSPRGEPPGFQENNLFPSKPCLA